MAIGVARRVDVKLIASDCAYEAKSALKTLEPFIPKLFPTLIPPTTQEVAVTKSAHIPSYTPVKLQKFVMLGLLLMAEMVIIVM